MQGDHTPNPKRFEVFTELPNGKGFKIKDSKYIYMFDKYGGWYDEYNNYYNPDGEPEQPPSDEEQQFQRTVLQDQFDEDDYDDFYQKQYGANLDQIQDDYQQDNMHSSINPHQKILQVIAHNAANLHEYPLKVPLRVDFTNMSFKATKQQVLKHYRSKLGKGILNVILIKQDGKFIGQGYFVCDNVSTAQKLIKYEGENFQGRPVSFDVQQVEAFLAEPVTREQSGIAINQDDFESLVKETPKIQQSKEQSKGNKKKYITKSKVEQQKQISKTNPPKKQDQLSKKPQQKVLNSPTKQEKVQQPKKQQIKQVKPQVPSWSKYIGDVTMFKTKTSFKQWMNKLGYNQNEHFKNPEKTQSKDPTKKLAKVDLRSDVYVKIEGSLYDGHKIHFEKTN